MQMITKQRALQESWDKWVKGNEPRAVRAKKHGVTSAHYRKGKIGCAIGQYLLDVDMKPFEGRSVVVLFEEPEIAARFEGAEDYPGVCFWKDLQKGHDLDFKHSAYAARFPYPEPECVRAFWFMEVAECYGVELTR